MIYKDSTWACIFKLLFSKNYIFYYFSKLAKLIFESHFSKPRVHVNFFLYSRKKNKNIILNRTHKWRACNFLKFFQFLDFMLVIFHSGPLKLSKKKSSIRFKRNYMKNTIQIWKFEIHMSLDRWFLDESNNITSTT